MRCGRWLSATLVLISLTAAACSTQQKMVYLLPDGRIANNDPALNRQLQTDLTVCNDEMSRSVQFGDHGDGSSSRGKEVMSVGDDCMEEKGYLEVRQDQAAAKQQELAAGARGAPPRN
jgi:hypothetical protein